MLLSYSHKFIFVHIPKTAGSSVTVALGAVAHRPQRLLVNRGLKRLGFGANRFGPHPWKWFRQHEPAAVMKKHLPAEIFGGFFKFAFVRNPWDQLVSYYHWIKQTPAHGRHQQVRAMSFAEYLRYETSREKFSQQSFITDRDGRLLVDFVGRFERLADDFRFVCNQLGLAPPLAHAKKSDRGDYREYYTPPDIELVKEHFRSDIERFGYSFEGVSESRNFAGTLQQAG